MHNGGRGRKNRDGKNRAGGTEVRRQVKERVTKRPIRGNGLIGRRRGQVESGRVGPISFGEKLRDLVHPFVTTDISVTSYPMDVDFHPVQHTAVIDRRSSMI